MCEDLFERYVLLTYCRPLNRHVVKDPQRRLDGVLWMRPPRRRVGLPLPFCWGGSGVFVPGPPGARQPPDFRSGYFRLDISELTNLPNLT